MAANASGVWSGAVLEVRKPKKTEVREVLDIGGLAVASGSKHGPAESNGKPYVVLGRKEKNCDIVVDHGSLSRVHAALVPVFTNAGKSELVVIDLGSSQGTFINDERLEANVPVPLRSPQDVLRFGTSKKLYQLKSVANEKSESISAKDTDTSTSTSTSMSNSQARMNEESMTREQRQAEINRLALEMSTSAPVYKTLKQTAAAEESLSEPNVNSIINDEEDDDDSEGPQPLAASGKLFQGVPHSEHICINAQTKSVCAIGIDRAGSRFAVGGNDCKISIFDFGGMNESNKPFREIRPVEDQVVRALSFSPTGKLFLVILADSVAVIYDRDAREQTRTTKGDPYLMDMTKTKGHPSMITDGAWSPVSNTMFITSGIDGTVRMWDLERSQRTLMDSHLMSLRIIKTKTARATRVAVHSCAWTPSGDRIVAGCSDGSLQIWNVSPSAAYIRPDITVRSAHSPDKEITCVQFSPDGKKLASRSQDGTLKLWDSSVRRGDYREIFSASERLENDSSSTGLTFSPNGKFVITGETTFGDLVIFPVEHPKSRPLRLSIKEFIEETEKDAHQVVADDDEDVKSSMVIKPVSVQWHDKLNQIFIGCSNGATVVLFDKELSSKGALLSSHRRASTKRAYYASSEAPKIREEDIILPNALPMFRKDIRTNSRPSERTIRKDPVASQRPDLPPSAKAESFGPKPTRDSAADDIRAELMSHRRDDDDEHAARIMGPRVLASTTMEEDEERMDNAKRPRHQ